MKNNKVKKSNVLSKVILNALSNNKNRITTVGYYSEMYDKMIERMQFVKESCQTVSTYPVEPEKGVNKDRDRYFKKSYEFMQAHPEVSVQRIVTITDISKYQWVAKTIELYKKCDNFSLGYLKAEEVRLPFLGIILFDKKELFLIAITDPEKDALYIHTTDKYLCVFFEHYIKNLWKDYCIQLKHTKKIFYERLTQLQDRLRQPNFIEHDIHKKMPPTIRVAISQIDLTYLLKEEKGLLVCTDKRRLKKKIDKILKMAIKEDVDLVVLPELSIYRETIKYLEQVSAENNIVIIGGSCYNDDRKNICPIFIPEDYSKNGSKCFFTEKVNLSPYERSPVYNEGAIEGNNINIFYNSTLGTFAVIICADYLDKNIVDLLYRRRIDMLIVCSLNGNSQKFLTDMSRECELSKYGIYILYSNAIYRKPVKKPFGDGQSSIVGQMHYRFIKKLGRPKRPAAKYQLGYWDRKSEGIISATLDLVEKKPLVWGPGSKPNVTNISLHKIKL